MKKTFRKTSAMLCAITVMASSMSFSGFVANANDEPTTSDYTLTIPATLAVANSGWNATAGISATGKLATGKKLVVTASSANSWALKSGENTIGYNLATATGTYSSSATPASWEFTELSNTAMTKPMGIIVEDYSTKPAGDYSDTVTFTASVEDSFECVLAPALENGAKISFAYNWNERNNTYFEFTNNNGSYTLSSLTGESPEFFNTTNLKVNNPNVLILDVVSGEKDEDEFDRDEDFCSKIEFDTTDNTFIFTKRGVKCKLISVSVNGNDVTNKLTDNSTDKS